MRRKMKKAFLLILSLIGFISSSYSDGIQICYINKVAASFDKNDVWKYSPLKAFDSSPSTCLAVPKKSMDEYGFLRVGFLNETEIDGISIEPGFFDDKYYYLNYRIKKIKITISKVGTSEDEIFTFDFVDEMKDQYCKFPRRVKCKYITFDIIELYKTDKDQDICISEISFFNKSKKLDLEFTSSRYSKTVYTYDGQNRIIEMRTRADHIFHYVLLAYPQGQKVVCIIETAYSEEGPCKTELMYFNTLQEVFDYVLSARRGDLQELRATANGDYKQIVKMCTITGKKREITYYYYKGILISDTFGEYLYKNGKLVGYFAYSSVSTDDENEYDYQYFGSYEIIYDENGLPCEKYYSSLYAY